MVNWPITWNPGMHMVKKLIDDGVAGDIIQIKTRMGHTGPLGPGAKHRGINETAAPMTDVEKTRTWWHQHTSGGGAMSDYCCYGGVLSYWYAGKPAVAAMGMRINSITTMGDAEDNAAMFVRYPDCYAVLEATWTTYDHTFKSPIVYGTKGAIVGDYKTGKVQFHGADGCVNDIPNDPLPEELKDVSTAYVHHMDTGKPLHLTSQIEFNLNALAILDAGIRSANSNKMEIVNNINWQIG
jgi:predicted dehydrogenase